ncbi:hypothetical protein QE375_001931 [Microbacterium foliorum]|uniref:DUF2510 domain-containing protein n=1 Tax=Microbacterium foliorum TaxID=104336 RepID=A0ABU1HRC2_9MICO|nr:DUF2510 domain-containing protein [Microbacterium foliorum]MDR6142377.1 hypothetical protein [Microbacterium foliorum]
MTDQSPVPGWYPAPHANNEQRYWDGAQWLDREPDSAHGGEQSSTTTKAPRGLAIAALAVGIIAFLTGLVPVVGAIFGIGAVAIGTAALLKKQPKGFAITGLVLGAVALLTSIAMTAGLVNFASSSDRPAAVDSSAPTASSSPAADPESTEETQEPEAPEAPSAPVVARQDFTGAGDMVLDVNVTEAAIVSFSCGDCSSNTVVKTNGRESLLVNTIGAYAGSHLINIEVGAITTQIVIESAGNWTLAIDDVTTAPVFDTAASGTGDSVIILTGGFDAAAITNDAGSNFVIKAYGDGNYSPLIVNEIGAYSGTVQMSAPAVVQVISEGNWSITGQ